MKNIFKQILGLTILSFMLFSCDTEDLTGDSVVNYVAPTATFTLAGGNSVTVQETAIPTDGVTYEINATIPEPIVVDLYIDLTQTGGNADAGDFSVERIKIPAYATSGSGFITLLKSGDVEGVETLDITANTDAANVNGSDTFSFTIEDDYINDNLMMTFAWCDDFEYDDNGVTLTGNFGLLIDIDLVVIGPDTVTTGATGDCPEIVEFGGLADGLYKIAVQVYANDASAFGMGTDIPFVVSYYQEYFIDEMPLEHTLTLNSDANTGILGLIAEVEKVGNTFTVTAL